MPLQGYLLDDVRACNRLPLSGTGKGAQDLLQGEASCRALTAASGQSLSWRSAAAPAIEVRHGNTDIEARPRPGYVREWPQGLPRHPHAAARVLRVGQVLRLRHQIGNRLGRRLVGASRRDAQRGPARPTATRCSAGPLGRGSPASGRAPCGGSVRGAASSAGGAAGRPTGARPVRAPATSAASWCAPVMAAPMPAPSA